MFPLILLQCVSTLSWQRQSRAFHSRYTRLLSLPDTEAQDGTSAQRRSSRTESQTDTTLKHSVNIRNKILHVDTIYFTKIHKQNIIMCRARMEVNRSDVFRSCDHTQSCNYPEISSSHNSSCPATLCSETQPVFADGLWSMEQTRSRAFRNAQGTSRIPGLALFPKHIMNPPNLTHFWYQVPFSFLFSIADSTPLKYAEFLSDLHSSIARNCRESERSTQTQEQCGILKR